MKQHLMNPRTKVCLCGKPAVKFRLGDFVCQRCMDFEHAYYGEQRRGPDRQKRKPRMEHA
jgi:hypothetical protein